MFDLIALNVARRYAAVVNQGALDKWAKDLKVMTKIYRDIPVSIEWDDTEGREKAYGYFREAEKLFLNFRNGFEAWVYKVVLPRMDKSEAYLVKELRTSTWDFLHTIRSLFPTKWDGQSSQNVKHIPDLSGLKAKREGNIKRYQVAFKKVYKQLSEYIESKGGVMVRYDAVDHVEVAGVPVILENLGRDEGTFDYTVEPLNLLGKHLKTVKGAGFAVALDGLKVTINFTPDKFDEAGKYNPATDTLTLHPLGMIDTPDGHTLIHEIGHRFWFKCLPGQARSMWEEILSDRGVTIFEGDIERFFHIVESKLTKDFAFMDAEDILKLTLPAAKSKSDELKFQELSETHIRGLGTGPGEPFDAKDYLRRLMFKKDEVVQVEEVSDYGDSSPVEGFAEAFRLWVTKGPQTIKPFTRELFVQVCRAGDARI
jgi:hypothetical protein